MKRIFFFAALLILGLSSCKKFLDTTPTDFYTPINYYNSAAELQQALQGCYGLLAHQNIWGQYQNYSFNSATDELISNQNNSNAALRAATFTYDATNSYIAAGWQYLYLCINNCNGVIDNINRPTMDSTQRNVILGQAKYIRGYCYFLLTMNWRNVPLVLHQLGLSNVSVAASPAADIYAQIETDMKSAETLLKTQTLATQTYNDVVTQDAVQAMLARVYMYWAGYPLNNTAKYQDALTYCTKVINSGNHSLNPDYKQIFINLCQDKYDVKEDLWEVGSYGTASGGTGSKSNDYGNFVGIQSTLVTTDTSSYGSADWTCVTQKLYDAYPLNTASPATLQPSYDLRRDWNCANYKFLAATVTTTNPLGRQKVTIANPWLMCPGKIRREYVPYAVRVGANYNINIQLMRYADVLLMYAEAYNQVNKGPGSFTGNTSVPTTAYDAINMVRRRGWGILYGNLVKNIAVTAGGSGYTTAATVTMTGGGGTGAAAVPIFTNGTLTGMIITNAGTGYTSGPTITIAGAGGTGATATAAVGNGKVITIQIVNRGSGYTNGVNVTISGGGGSGATGVAQVVNGVVTNVILTSPGTLTTAGPYYTSAPTVTISGGGGTGATATATITNSTDADLPAGLSQTDFQSALRDERLKELCFEFVRKWDLIRWYGDGAGYGSNGAGISYPTYMNNFANYAIANGTNTTPGSFLSAIYQSVLPKHLLQPVPQYELGLDHALTQNPGW